MEPDYPVFIKPNEGNWGLAGPGENHYKINTDPPPALGRKVIFGVKCKFKRKLFDVKSIKIRLISTDTMLNSRFYKRRFPRMPRYWLYITMSFVSAKVHSTFISRCWVTRVKCAYKSHVYLPSTISIVTMVAHA